MAVSQSRELKSERLMALVKMMREHINGGVSSFIDEIGQALSTLVKSHLQSRSGDEFSRFIAKMDSAINSGELDIKKAAYVMKEMHYAIYRANPSYWMEERKKDHPLNQWEKSADALARKILLRLTKDYNASRMDVSSAAQILNHVSPYLLDNSGNQSELASARELISRSQQSFHRSMMRPAFL